MVLIVLVVSSDYVIIIITPSLTITIRPQWRGGHCWDTDVPRTGKLTHSGSLSVLSLNL